MSVRTTAVHQLVIIMLLHLLVLCAVRTIVAPPFMQHFQDKDHGKRKMVTPNLRLDLNLLSKLVTISPSWEMQRKCNHKFDIGFQVA